MQSYYSLFLILVISITVQTYTVAQTSEFSGKVTDGGSREALVGATLLLTDAAGQQRGTTTNEKGLYEFTELSPGRYRLEVSYVGYEKFIDPGFLVGSGPSTKRNFSLQPGNDAIPSIVVSSAPSAVLNPLERSVSLEAVRRLPATFYDPARLLTLSPGVAPTNDQANHLSVRGNSPNRNLWRLNGLAIVNPNHTANAGTILDLPTFSGGGVNALSAQLLDNSTFYPGALPTAYGNATGGTLDMHLRPGNNQRRRHQLQAGLIGIDLATEGPFSASSPNSGSYLVNYRYSFTGLLADMGVDFGGEEIRFQDFSAHLFQPVGQTGQLSVFGIYGKSSNEFTGKDEEVEERKELFDIDFFSDLLVVGGTYEQQFGDGKLEAGLSYSETLSERYQELRSDRSRNNRFDLNMERLSGRLAYTYFGPGLLEVSGGLEYLSESASLDIGLPTEGYEQTVLSPYLHAAQRLGRLGLSAGLRYSLYTNLAASNVFEPRLSLAYYGGSSAFTLTAERNSRIPAEVFVSQTPDDTEEDLIPVTSQISLGWNTLAADRNRFGLSVYYQYTPDEYAFALESVIPISDEAENANSTLGVLPGATERFVNTRSYGLELSYEQPIRPEAWYYTVNLSLFRSEYEDRELGWLPGRFSRNFIFQSVVGKEWDGQNKRGKARSFGANFSIIAAGGERFGELTTVMFGGAFYDTSQGLTDQVSTYVRPDLRLYRRKFHRKTTTTLALDIQNVIGRENAAFRAYDEVQRRIVDRTQLGLIPVLSYRIEWR